jgi:hypothetical protein
LHFAAGEKTVSFCGFHHLGACIVAPDFNGRRSKKAIRAKIRPEPVRELLPPTKR